MRIATNVDPVTVEAECPDCGDGLVDPATGSYLLVLVELVDGVAWCGRCRQDVKLPKRYRR